MASINIKKSKDGKWSPVEVEKTFKALKENLNGIELANLHEMLTAEKFFNQTGTELLLSHVATPKDKLIRLHREFYGSDLKGDESELSLVVEILEQLVEKVEEQDGHLHNIN